MSWVSFILIIIFLLLRRRRKWESSTEEEDPPENQDEETVTTISDMEPTQNGEAQENPLFHQSIDEIFGTEYEEKTML